MINEKTLNMQNTYIYAFGRYFNPKWLHQFMHAQEIEPLTFALPYDLSYMNMHYHIFNKICTILRVRISMLLWCKFVMVILSDSYNEWLVSYHPPLNWDTHTHTADQTRAHLLTPSADSSVGWFSFSTCWFIKKTRGRVWTDPRWKAADLWLMRSREALINAFEKSSADLNTPPSLLRRTRPADTRRQLSGSPPSQRNFLLLLSKESTVRRL